VRLVYEIKYGALFKEKKTQRENGKKKREKSRKKNPEKGDAGKNCPQEKKRYQDKKNPRKEKHYCPPPPLP
jgi:hypothetical protein